MSFISIIITLVILSLIVVIHEWGHFMAAKLCKVNIEEFAVGMGPKLIGFTKKGTLYSIRAFLIGGYCKMTDEIEDYKQAMLEEEDEKVKSKMMLNGDKGYNEASLLQRIFISFAGPFMNFILALLLMAILTSFTGVATLKVTSLSKGGAAERAGIQTGDVITKYGTHSLWSRNDLSYYMYKNAGEPVDITVKRGSQKIKYTLTPELDEKSGSYLLGVVLDYKAPLFGNTGGYERENIFDTIVYGTLDMASYVKLTALSFVDIVTGQLEVNQLSGPIGMVSAVDDVYEQTSKISFLATLLVMLQFSALISISLGIINLFPLPALDGGRIIIYIAELIVRKELPTRVENAIHLTGFVLLMGLGIYIAVLDVMKLL